MPFRDRNTEENILKARMYRRKHYHLNKEYYIFKTREREKILRDFISMTKQGKTCKYCSENNLKCLEYHHRLPNKKKYDVSDMSHNGCSTDTILKEIAKCDLICANCHRKLTWR